MREDEFSFSIELRMICEDSGYREFVGFDNHFHCSRVGVRDDDDFAASLRYNRVVESELDSGCALRTDAAHRQSSFIPSSRGSVFRHSSMFLRVTPPELSCLKVS